MPACLRAFQPPKAKKTLTFNGKLLANADELSSACHAREGRHPVEGSDHYLIVSRAVYWIPACRGMTSKQGAVELVKRNEGAKPRRAKPSPTVRSGLRKLP